MPAQPSALIYTRVSSEEQASGGISLDMQLADCRAACERRGWQVAETLSDEGFSAFTRKPRPAFLELQRRLSEFDVVVIWRLDRFGRQNREIQNVIGDILERGIGVYSVMEPQFDLSTPVGRLMFNFAAALAQYEPEQSQERVRRAMLEVVQQGRKLGFAPYGYLLPEPKGIIIPDPVTAPVVQSIFASYAGGAAIVQICRDLQGQGIPSPRGKPVWYTGIVRKMLERETYLGKVAHTRTGLTLDGLHEPLIDRPTWDAVQRRLQANVGVPSRARSATLSNLLRCGYCGARLHIMGTAKDQRLYYCQQRTLSADRHEPLFVTDWIAEGYAWTFAEELLSPDAEVGFKARRPVKSHKPTAKIATLQKQRAALEENIRYNLRAAREAGLPMRLLADENAAAAAQLAAVEGELARLLARESAALPSATSLRQTLAQVRTADYGQQRAFLGRLFREVRFYRDRVVFALAGDPLEVTIAKPKTPRPHRSRPLTITII